MLNEDLPLNRIFFLQPQMHTLFKHIFSLQTFLLTMIMRTVQNMFRYLNLLLNQHHHLQA